MNIVSVDPGRVVVPHLPKNFLKPGRHTHETQAVENTHLPNGGIEYKISSHFSGNKNKVHATQHKISFTKRAARAFGKKTQAIAAISALLMSPLSAAQASRVIFDSMGESAFQGQKANKAMTIDTPYHFSMVAKEINPDAPFNIDKIEIAVAGFNIDGVLTPNFGTTSFEIDVWDSEASMKSNPYSGNVMTKVLNPGSYTYSQSGTATDQFSRNIPAFVITTSPLNISSGNSSKLYISVAARGDLNSIGFVFGVNSPFQGTTGDWSLGPEYAQRLDGSIAGRYWGETVPEPSGLLAIGSGLISLGGNVARNRKRKRKASFDE